MFDESEHHEHHDMRGVTAQGETQPRVGPETLDPHDVRRVAVVAVCDTDTVRRYLAGGRMQPTSIRRVERALRRLRLDVRRENAPTT